MPRFTALTKIKKMLLPGMFAAALAALIGVATETRAEAAPPLWSIVVHIEYQDGFVYEHAFATGVPTEMSRCPL